MAVPASEKGEIKNDGGTHDVIEKKEERVDTLTDPTMSMKTQGLFFIATMLMKTIDLPQAIGRKQK